MAQKILSLAIYELVPAKKKPSLATLPVLVAGLAVRGYSRDTLYRDGAGHYVLFRWWASEAMRQAAHEDADVLRCWAKLGNEIRVIKIYETLDEVSMK